MPMPLDTDKFLEELLGDANASANSWLNEVGPERKEIVSRALARLATTSAAKVSDPQNAATHEADFNHNWNTLLSEAARANALGRQEFWDFVGRLSLKLVEVVLAAAI
jgi:hypothetical protein